MKNCHFSILYNEYNFLTQKLPLLYKLFDQIIFYDLNVVDGKHRFSNDGSHEYIKHFPDPENKIILIEETNLDNIKNYNGVSVLGKQKMFAKASEYINDNIDIFWCTDMDEFFDEDYFNRINKEMLNDNIKLIRTPHKIFWKNSNYIFVEKDGNQNINFPLARIVKHKPGFVYGHCNLKTMYDEKYHVYLEDIQIYHFSYVGEERVKFKLKYLPSYSNYMKMWDTMEIIDNKIYGFPNMHPNPSVNYGVKIFDGNLPSFINKKIIDNIK